MLAWIWRFLVGDFCKHEWIIIEEGEIIIDGVRRGNFYNLQCKNCGKIKYKRCSEL